MKWLHFFLSHSIFISICAVALCLQTYILLHIPPDRMLLRFVFFSTLCSYNAYWIVSKYSFTDNREWRSFLSLNFSYIILFVCAGSGMLYFGLKLPHLYPLIALGIVFTALYSLPIWPFHFAKWFRKAGFVKTGLLSFTWTFVTVLLPAAELWHTEANSIVTLFAARFCFMLLLCSIFDHRDKQMDKNNALHSLATDLSDRSFKRIMQVIFILYLICGIFVRYHFDDDAQIISFLLTGVWVAWAYKKSLQKQGYVFYYFMIDGLMLLSAGMSWIADFLFGQ